MYGPTCAGEGRHLNIADAVIVRDADGWLRPDRAYVTCPDCGYTGRGRITRGPQGIRWVVVPIHTRRRLVVTLKPRKEYL